MTQQQGATGHDAAGGTRPRWRRARFLVFALACILIVVLGVERIMTDGGMVGWALVTAGSALLVTHLLALRR